MLNDRDEKYETPEDSEYHFSDDDISYEVEPETAKPAASPTTTKESIFNKLSRSRRMLISLAVFLVLVFVVYKMVAPTGQTTPADISTVIQPVAQQPPTPPGGIASTEPVTPPPAAAIAPPTQQPAPETQAAVPQQPVMAPPPQVQQPMYNQQPSMAQPAPPAAPPQSLPVQQPMATQQPMVPVQQPMQPPQQQAMVQQPMVQQPLPSMAQQQPMMQQPVQQQPMPQQQVVMAPPQPQVVPVQTMQQPVQQLPAVSPPVENVVMAPPAASPPYVHDATATSSLSQQVPGGIDAGIAQISAQNEKLIAQMQTEYVKRLNEYASQNKNLNDQMAQLTSRVASMETEMHKLLQTITKQISNTARPAQPPREVPVQVNVPRIAYNVQAIIPGRAWLRSDSGDTVTVAEGDLIKNVGRVVKIDPYDGVVEINTGTRVISLSYGNGG